MTAGRRKPEYNHACNFCGKYISEKYYCMCHDCYVELEQIRKSLPKGNHSYYDILAERHEKK